jgi:hypothetical protein
MVNLRDWHPQVAAGAVVGWAFASIVVRASALGIDYLQVRARTASERARILGPQVRHSQPGLYGVQVLCSFVSQLLASALD